MSAQGLSAISASGAKLHMGIAEQGKAYALAGNHTLALAYYRHAMHMAVRAKEPEVFFRHYLECIIESLEHMGAYQEVLEYCAKAIQFYAEHPPPNPLALKDLVHVYERQGAVLLKQGEKEQAALAFEQAMVLLKGSGGVSPLIQNLLRWIKTGMHIEPRRVLAEQQRARYFSVRRDTVDPERAIKLPDEQLFGPPATFIRSEETYGSRY